MKILFLRLIVNLYDDNGNLQQIQLEKRARVNIFDDLRGNNEFTEYMSAGTPDPITLNELVERTRTTVGDYRFYSYDGFNNNCQGFVKMLLETMGLWNERNKKFTYQHLEPISAVVQSSNLDNMYLYN